MTSLSVHSELPALPRSAKPLDFSYEHMLQRKGYNRIAGVDEAGRGPWAGPVVAAAVILNPDAIPEGLNDSKKLSETAREKLYTPLVESSQFGIGIADVKRIDKMNILHASLWAMAQACKNLPRPPGAALIDGNKCPKVDFPVQAIVKGDQKILSIAAASIIAKVTRDRLMIQLAQRHPGYGWESNKGYGTKQHQDGLAKLGICIEHRRSFKPIQKLMAHEG